MSTWRIVLITLAVLIAVCAAQEHLNSRPIRPDSFSSPTDVKDYVNRVRNFYAKSGTRFGKRFSPVHYKEDSHPSARQDWRSIYDLLDNYEAM